MVIPEGIVTTGWPQVVKQCELMGIRFEPWQDGIGRITLGKRADGKYAATIGGVVLSIPRQVGKTFLVGTLMMALCILFPGYTVLWTAHRMRTSTRTFQSLQRMAKRKKVAPYILAVRMANGEQEIAFKNGSTILFGAREQGFGRGFDEVDAEVFDEAQILTDKALEDMVAATNQSRHLHGALLFFMGTPPRPVDPGEAFGYKRDQALTGKSADIAYVEMSADSDADPDDREQWSKANPSFPELTPLESMLRMRTNLPSLDSWLREGLGIWADENVTGLFDLTVWHGLADAGSQPATGAVFGIDVTPDHAWSALALSGRRADRLMHVDVDDVDGHRRGTAWVVERCAELARRYKGAAFVIDGGGPGKSLIPALEAAGLPLTVMATGDVTAACGLFVDAVAERTLRHRGQQLLDAAVAGAQPRPVGDGPIAFGRKKSDGDISPLNAACFAHWAAATSNYDVLQSVR